MRNTATVYVPNERLPLWMQQARARIDWGVLIVFAFSLMAGWAFIAQPGLPQTNATENHVYLASDYAQTLREGRLYPRWSAHAISGYGAPIPHFYPPGTPYATALLDILFTSDSVNATRAVYVLALCLAGCATYTFVLRFADSTAAILSSLLYVYSPYMGLVAPHILGDLPGVVGLALLPTLLWSISRLLDAHAPTDFALTALSSAALLLTDPALWGIALLLGGVLMLHHGFVSNRRQGRILWTLLALSAGLLMTGFYWLPALIDQNAVVWTPNANTAPTHALAFPQIITPLSRIDLGALLPEAHFTIGLPLLLALAASVLGLLTQRSWPVRRNVVLLVSGLALGGYAAVIAPSQVWLLGPVTFCLAAGSSALAAWKERIPENLRTLYLPIVLAAILAFSIPVWLSPRWEIALTGDDVTPQAQLDYAQRGYGIAVLPPDAAAPAPVNPPLATDRLLDVAYASGEVNRITTDQNTATRQFTPLATRTHSDRYQATIAADGVIRVLRGYFPGWQATLDGVQTPVNEEPNTGLVQVRVTAGQIGTLNVFMGATVERQRAWFASWLMLGVVVLVTLRRMRRPSPPRLPVLNLMAITEARLVSFLLLGFIGLLLIFAVPDAPLTLHARPGHGLDNTVAVQNATEIGLELISLDISDTTISVGESLAVTLAWRRLAREGIQDIDDYQVYLHLTDDNQNVRWQVFPAQEPGAYPTSRWPFDVYVRDIHRLTISSAVVPGTYRLGVEVNTCDPTCDPLRRLRFADGEQVLLLPVTLTITQ